MDDYLVRDSRLLKGGMQHLVGAVPTLESLKV